MAVAVAFLALPRVAAADRLSLHAVEYLTQEHLVKEDPAVIETLQWCRRRTARRVDCRVDGGNDEGRSWSDLYRWELRGGRLFLAPNRQRAVPFIGSGIALGRTSRRETIVVSVDLATKAGRFVPHQVTETRTDLSLSCSDGSAEDSSWDPSWEARIGRGGTFADRQSEKFSADMGYPEYPRSGRATLGGRTTGRTITGTLRVEETYAGKTCDSGAVSFTARIEPLPRFTASSPRFTG